MSNPTVLVLYCTLPITYITWVKLGPMPRARRQQRKSWRMANNELSDILFSERYTAVSCCFQRYFRTGLGICPHSHSSSLVRLRRQGQTCTKHRILALIPFLFNAISSKSPQACDSWIPLSILFTASIPKGHHPLLPCWPTNCIGPDVCCTRSLTCLVWLGEKSDPNYYDAGVK